MKLSIDTDFLLPIMVALLTIVFVTGYQTLTPNYQIENVIFENQDLFSELSAANRELDTITKQLNKYQATQESIENLGASPLEAKQVMMAAKVYNLDPKLLGALIASESSFSAHKHSLDYVIGLCGINTNCGSALPYTPYSDFGNILDAAKLLRDYKNLYKTDLLAVTRYKGWGQIGFSQACHVMKIRSTVK